MRLSLPLVSGSILGEISNSLGSHVDHDTTQIWHHMIGELGMTEGNI